MVSKVFVCHCSAGFRIPELEGRDSWCHSTPCAINHRWWVAKQLVGQGWVGKWQKYRRLYDSRVCQHLTWLTFWIAQHFVVPLFLGILQPGKDAPSPSVSDFLTLKTIQVSPSTLRLMWLLHARKVPTSQSLPSLSLSLYRTISIHLYLLSMWSPTLLYGLIQHDYSRLLEQFQLYLSFDLVSSQRSSVTSSTGNRIKCWYPHHYFQHQVPAEFSPHHPTCHNLLQNVTIKDLSIWNSIRCKWDRVCCSPEGCEYRARGLQSFSRCVSVRHQKACMTYQRGMTLWRSIRLSRCQVYLICFLHVPSGVFGLID